MTISKRWLQNYFYLKLYQNY